MLDSLERARESERRFLADASHELRTPLTALRGNVAHLARHGSSPDLIADLEADAERIARLADDLLALSREESGAGAQGEEVDLGELASAVEAPDIEVAAEPVWVLGDRPALERALSNLVENARRHGPPGGRIRVDVRTVDGLALLEVEDEGPGRHRARSGSSSSASGAPGRTAAVRDSASRSSRRPPSGTAGGRSSRAPASRSSCLPSGKLQRTRAKWSTRATRKVHREDPPHPLDHPSDHTRSRRVHRARRRRGRRRRRPRRRRGDAPREAARTGGARLARGREAGRRDGADHLHEQALPLRGARRPGRLGAHVRRDRAALVEPERRAPRAAIRRRRCAADVERQQGDPLRRVVEHRVHIRPAAGQGRRVDLDRRPRRADGRRDHEVHHRARQELDRLGRRTVERRRPGGVHGQGLART